MVDPDGDQQSTDRPPAPDALRIQILATEHWGMLATRSMTWNEMFARAGMFITVLSASIVSMALCTTAFAWLLTRRVIDPVYRTILIPAFGLFGVTFGLWYAGLV